MGTHPIFESDFDCLTEFRRKMVKAGDIGKASKDFLKKDFFSHNEVKVTQAGCCASKNTTTFKLGDAVKADHKIEMKSCPLTKVPAKVTLGSTTATDVEWTFKQGAASNKLTASTNLASILDVNNLKLKNEFDFAKDVSGINTHLNMNTTTKGTNFPQPINFGFGLEKSGYQFGVTGTVNDITAPAVSKMSSPSGGPDAPTLTFALRQRPDLIGS